MFRCEWMQNCTKCVRHWSDVSEHQRCLSMLRDTLSLRIWQGLGHWVSISLEVKYNTHTQQTCMYARSCACIYTHTHTKFTEVKVLWQKLNNRVFCDVTPCSLVAMLWCFAGKWHFHLQSRRRVSGGEHLFFWNDGKLMPDYMASHCRGQHSSDVT